MKLRLFLVFCLAVTTLAHAADFKTANGLCYNINADGKSVTVVGDDATYSFSELTIPSTVTFLGKRYTVTEVGGSAFSHCTSLKSVTLPSTITTIHNQAFAYCSKLTSVVIPDAVTTIGNAAFSSCSALTSVTLGSSLTSIGDLAFQYCKGLTSIDIPNKVTSIGGQAFDSCTNLADISIPNSVIYIGSSAFGYMGGTTPWYANQPDGMVYVGRVAYEYKGGMATDADITIKDGTVSITPGAFYDSYTWSGKPLHSVTIPASVTHIGARAFYKCRQLKVVNILGNSLKEIGEGAFERTALTNIDLPSSLTTIGRFAFANCASLSNLEFPNSLNHVGGWAFYNTKWLSNQPAGVVYAGRVAYSYKGDMPNGTTIKFKEGTLSISGDAFSVADPYSQSYTPKGYSNLVKVVIPNSVTKIGSSAFAWCKDLASVSIGDAVEEIGEAAFVNCTSLSQLTLGNSVASIGNSAFSGCENLAEVTLPESLQSIGDNAFSSCPLTEIDIPNQVNTIGSRAFEGCEALENVTVGESVFKLGGVLFNGSNDNINRVVWNAKRANSMSYSWQRYAACYECTAYTFVFGDSVVNIPSFFGYASSWAKSITIGKSVEWIGEYAFYGCTKKLRTIKCSALVPPKIPNSDCTFKKKNGSYPDITLYVPAKTVKYYKTAEVWKNFTILPLGDMTGESVVDVDDLSAIIDMVLHKAISRDAADLNSDGVVDIDDIGLLINTMIGK